MTDAAAHGGAPTDGSKVTVLVTGGTGLVGSALKKVFETEGGALGAEENWVFLSSKDGDLRSAHAEAEGGGWRGRWHTRAIARTVPL